MQRLGIETRADLRRESPAFLQHQFGKSAACYLGIANGEDHRPVVADRQRKSSGSETTFERDLTASAGIEAGVDAIVDDLWPWCEKTRRITPQPTATRRIVSSKPRSGRRRVLKLLNHHSWSVRIGVRRTID
jgi:nucleotidyltransferase/DNA polymerase involved in DNA repair